MMGRREFITLFGGTVAAWSVAARAQQAAMPMIGWINAGSARDPYYINLVAAFHAGLKETGYVDGQNVAIDFHWAEGEYGRLPAMAAELVTKRIAVIAAGGPPAAVAAKAATTAIPIVFTVGEDPVKLNLVASLSHPGGNATGISLITNEIESKRLGLLAEIVPAAATIGVLLNGQSPTYETQVKDVQAGAQAGGLHVDVVTASNEPDIRQAFATLGQMHPGALLVGSDPFLTSFRDELVVLAAQQSLPTMFAWPDAARNGGLMSYSISFADAYRQAGVYVGRVLKGDKPSELPVQQSSKFEFLINLKTAKALGLAIPSGVMAIADEVIE
jgi:putative ABC transport system substrate-binding protein